MQQKHSAFGIAAFALALFAGFCMFLLFAAAGVAEAVTPGGIDDDSPILIVLGLGIIGLLFMEVLALGLGIAGCCQKEARRVFAVLGIALPILTIALTVGLIGLGIMMEG